MSKIAERAGKDSVSSLPVITPIPAEARAKKVIGDHEIRTRDREALISLTSTLREDLESSLPKLLRKIKDDGGHVTEADREVARRIMVHINETTKFSSNLQSFFESEGKELLNKNSDNSKAFARLSLDLWGFENGIKPTLKENLELAILKPSGFLHRAKQKHLVSLEQLNAKALATIQVVEKALSPDGKEFLVSRHEELIKDQVARGTEGIKQIRAKYRKEARELDARMQKTMDTKSIKPFDAAQDYYFEPNPEGFGPGGLVRYKRHRR